ncbi:MAG: hypothetical protein AAF488_11960, partial [Planctomycetota bacterium]
AGAFLSSRTYRRWDDGVFDMSPPEDRRSLRGRLSSDRVVFLLAPVVLFLTQGFHGLSETDSGFLTGISHRLLQGQQLYTDIIYVRPPVSPILHAGILALLPRSFELIGERAIFYGMAWWSCLFGMLALRRIYGTQLDGERATVPFVLCGTLAFVFSVNNFPPYPWHTLDGVFFASIGLYLTTRGSSSGWLFAGVVASLAAAGCKQSFYPIPLVAVVLSATLHGRTSGIRSAFLLALSLVGVLVLSTTLYPEAWAAFLEQSSAASGWGEAINAGFTKYLQAIPFVLVFLGVALFVRRRRGSFALLEWFTWLVVVGALVLNVIEAYEREEWQKSAYKYSQFMFLLALGVAIAGLRRFRRFAVTLLAFLSVSWCAGISWGTKHPILYFTPVVFGVMHLVRTHWEGRWSPSHYRTLILVVFGLYLAMAQFPRFDAPRWECTYRMSDLFPQATGVKIGAFQYRQYAELKELVAEYEEPFTVLPALPLAHYLTDTTPTLGVDWALNAELNGRRLKLRVLRELEESGSIVLIQRHWIEKKRERGDHPFGSWLTVHVVDHWELVEEGEMLNVYRLP